jgi:sec-independent protein translocase protein TatA
MGIGSIGPTELIIIFVIILLIFGGKKLPELARGLGKGIREFKRATKDVEDEIKDEINLKELDDDTKK